MNGTCEGRRRDDKVYISPFRYYCIYATNAAAAGSHRITSDSTTSTVQAKVKGRLKKKIATAAAAAGGSHKARTLKKNAIELGGKNRRCNYPEKNCWNNYETGSTRLVTETTRKKYK